MDPRAVPDIPDADGFDADIVTSNTGAELAVRHRPAEGAPMAVVCINHGLAEHSARYARFAKALSEAGVHVYAHDHRGHGGTIAPDGGPRVFAQKDGWNKVVSDACFILDRARALHPGVPAIVFGHSLGGSVALSVAMERSAELAGAAIWNANVSLGALAGLMKAILFAEGMVGGPRAPSKTLHALTFESWNKRFKPNRTDADWLSRDPAEVVKYTSDPMCGWPASVSMWRDLVRGAERGGDDRQLRRIRADLPMHLIGGEKDAATDGGNAVLDLERRLKKTGHTDVTRIVLPEVRHETLNEINRDDTTVTFVRWVEKVVAGAARPAVTPRPARGPAPAPSA